jgi:hypothetical protein
MRGTHIRLSEGNEVGGERDPRAALLYNQGRTIYEIGKVLGWKQWKVKIALLANGIEVEPDPIVLHAGYCERCGWTLVGATNRNATVLCDECHEELTRGMLYQWYEMGVERRVELGYAVGPKC